MSKRPEKSSPGATEAEPVTEGKAAAEPEGRAETVDLHAEIDRLRTELESLQAQHDELQDKYLRVWAEFDNFRKRMAKERADDATRAQAELLQEMLEALDDLNRVLTLDSVPPEAGSVLQGIRLVQEKLRASLERMGLEVIPAEGKRFDPEVHEALLTTPAESPDEDGMIALELRPGYRFRDRVLRPARVQVKRYIVQEGEARGEAT